MSKRKGKGAALEEALQACGSRGSFQRQGRKPMGAQLQQTVVEKGKEKSLTHVEDPKENR